MPPLLDDDPEAVTGNCKLPPSDMMRALATFFTPGESRRLPPEMLPPGIAPCCSGLLTTWLLLAGVPTGRGSLPRVASMMALAKGMPKA
mmetsp:Transcript_48010/g.104513  ORF Transcript_48010/g.104513 Transcript_48010/m.104513 type:complete len:89 (+) Transcript_48010:1516-1782(+)